MYLITAAEMNLIRDALDYAINQVEESGGQVCAFNGVATTDYDGQLQQAKDARALLQDLHSHDIDSSWNWFLVNDSTLLENRLMAKAKDLLKLDTLPQQASKVLDVLCAYLLVNHEVMGEAQVAELKELTIAYARANFADVTAALKSCPNYDAALFEDMLK